MANDVPSLLTLQQVAERLAQSPRSIRRKVASGELPALRLGTSPKCPLRFVQGEVEAWLYRTESSRPLAAAMGGESARARAGRPHCPPCLPPGAGLPPRPPEGRAWAREETR